MSYSQARMLGHPTSCRPEEEVGPTALRRHFEEIKRLFFPRWDRKNRWRVSSRSRRRVHGHCDPERRLIEIAVQYANADEDDALLIHEMCHAAAHIGRL